jgi:hypothetical protein
MLLSPLRRAPMMLGGVGFQAGLDEVQREQIAAQRQATTPPPDLVAQIKDLKALRDSGALSADEFSTAKRKLLAR